MGLEEISKEFDIKAKRSAFVMYVEEGIEIVEKYFPGQLKYVKANANKTLQEVFNELQAELKLISNN